MTRHTENRLRRLEEQHRLAPCVEVTCPKWSEAELLKLREVARKAVAGDAEAEAELNRLAGAALGSAR